jgi:signal transduction histidine kinase
MAEKSSVEKELIERISWFITLRWIIVVGICSTSLIASLVLKISLPIKAILTIAFCILLFNIVCTSLKKNVKSHEWFANIQISVDWIALVFLVHYTGGIESPVIFYFIFHVIIAATLLSRKECYLQTTFALLLISVLSILEYFNIVPHVHINELFPDPVYDNWLYLLARLFFFITSLYVSAFLATSVTNHLRKREKEIVVLKNNITDAYKKLEAIDNEKSEFTFKVTHELRSPLAAVYSLLKSIEEGYAGEISHKAKELITRAEKRTGFLLTLVNDLLDLVSGKISKPREGEMKLVNINEAVKNTIHLLQEKAKSKNLELIINVLPTPSFINVVPDDLDLILTNLIDNAVKYTAKGGTVSINNILTEEKIKVEITDTGIGIHKDDIHKIFNEFYRADNAKSLELDGTGLGLAIVNNLIKKYEADIEVQSTLGKGTTFTISFPSK